MKKDRLLWKVGKWRDIPDSLKAAFEKVEGGVPKVAYKNGKFYMLLWVRTNPLDWPIKIELQLDENDCLALTSDYGVEARPFAGMFIKKL